MAEVYGRLRGLPGVLIGQGPWVLGNGLLGTLEAHLSSSPMLLLTDFSDPPNLALHAPYQSGAGDYGGWDARRAFSGVTKQVFQALEPAQAVQATQFAIKHAMAGQKGPVAVLFSFAALNGKVGPDTVPTLYPTQLYMPPPPPGADPALIARGRGRTEIGAASGDHRRQRRAHRARPTRNCARWRRRSAFPVATSAGGKGTFAETHDLALGVYGTFGIATANAVVGAADLVLVVGSKLGASRYGAGESRAARPVAADLHPDRYRAAQCVVDLPGRARAGRRRRERSWRSCARRPARTPSAARRASRAWRSSARRPAISIRRPTTRPTSPIHPQRIIGELRRNLPANSIVTCDAGENRILMTHLYQTQREEGFMQAAGSGPMGFAMPAALGAKLVYPDRTVVAVCGDGGFAMSMNGLMTAIEEDIPIIVVVFNNAALGWVLHGGTRLRGEVQRLRFRQHRAARWAATPSASPTRRRWEPRSRRRWRRASRR